VSPEWLTRGDDRPLHLRAIEAGKELVVAHDAKLLHVTTRIVDQGLERRLRTRIALPGHTHQDFPHRVLERQRLPIFRAIRQRHGGLVHAIDRGRGSTQRCQHQQTAGE